MLAIKRALSIVLSTLLAMPTVTWAKAQPKRAPAQHIQVKHQSAMPVARKGKVQPKNGNSATPLVFVQGKPYELSEIPGRNGRLKSRTFSGPGYSEMIVDKNDDGFADVIQVTKGDVTTTALSPLRGKFRRIEVEKRLPKGTYKAILFMSHDERAYEVVDQRVYPKGKFGAEAASASGSGISANVTNAAELGAAIAAVESEKTAESQNAMLRVLNGQFQPTTMLESTNGNTRLNKCEAPIVIDSMEALDEALALALQQNPQWNMEQVLQCQLNKFQKLIMDSSCRTPEWQSSVQSMNWGLARVMSSYYDHKITPPPQPGRYLQCLSNQGWGDSAANVNRYVWEAFRNVTTQLMEAGLSRADFRALFSQVSPTPEGCTIPDDYEGAVSHHRINLDSIARRMAISGQNTAIACSATPDNNHRALYDENMRQIRLFKKADTIAAETPLCRNRNCGPVDAYAATFFHELTHASGFGERHEAIVENVEKCCSVSDGAPNSRDPAACEATRQSARMINMMQVNQASMSDLIPSYNDIAARIYRDFNPNGSYLLDDYNRALVGAVQETSGQVSTALRACENRAESQREQCTRDAFTPMNDAIEAATQRFFDRTCPLYGELAQADATTGLGGARSNSGLCGQYKTQLLSELRTGTVIGQLSSDLFKTDQQFTLPDLNDLRIPNFEISGGTLAVVADSSNTNSRANGSQTGRVASNQARVPTTSESPWSGNFVPDRTNPVGAQPPVNDTTDAESRIIAVDKPISLPTEIRFEPVQIDLPPMQPIVIEQPQVNRPTTTGRLSNPNNAAPTSIVRSQPVTTTPTTIAASNPSAVSPTQVTGRLSNPNNPTRTQAPSESAALNSSSISMPSLSSTNGTLGQPSASRPDIQAGRVSPGQMYVNNFVAGATRTVAAIGDVVAGRADAAELNTAARRANERQPASLQSRQAATPVAPTVNASVANTPQGLALATASTVVVTGAPTAAPERSIAVRGGRGENSVVINPQSQIQRTAAKPRDREDRDRDERSGSRTVARGGGPGAGGSSARIGGDRSGDDGGDQRNDGSTAERDRQVRALASAPVPGAGARSGQRSNFNNVQDATGMQVFIGRVNTEEMPRLLVNRDFVRKMRSVGVAVMDRNNNRIGAPPPAPVMELCQSRQRYVLEGTCR